MKQYLESIAASGKPIVGTNLIYDLDWIMQDFGVWFPQQWIDIQVIEPLIDENGRGYSLNSMAKKYLNETKVDDALFEYCAMHFGGKPDKSQMANIWKCPPHIVAPYAKGDVSLPLRILEKQQAIIKEQKLERIVNLEQRLQPMLLAMKRKGVRVDLERLSALRAELEEKREDMLQRLGAFNGGAVPRLWAAADLKAMFDEHKQPYPLTGKGAPSFTRPDSLPIQPAARRRIRHGDGPVVIVASEPATGAGADHRREADPNPVHSRGRRRLVQARLFPDRAAAAADLCTGPRRRACDRGV